MKSLEKLLQGIIIGGVICMLVFAFTSCSRGITVQEAASGKAKCGKHIRN